MKDLFGNEVIEKEQVTDTYKRGKVTLFDFINDLNGGKEYLLTDENQSDFSPFMVNRGMSQNVETIMFANEMNKHWQITKEMVHDFYFYIVPKKKRFGKWSKASGDDKDSLDLIVKHYGVSRLKAIDYLKLLSSEDINDIKLKYNEGGAKK